ncbi:MAG: hypothetical protein QCH35_03635 [Methanomicrobiaceae archaeon]|nr:hypothetical protein [Methanomicrobiaceae archaeon]
MSDNFEYIEKLTDIQLQHAIRPITVLHMEIPYCSGVHYTVDRALDRFGTSSGCASLKKRGFLTTPGRGPTPRLPPTGPASYKEEVKYTAVFFRITSKKFVIYARIM